MADLVAAFIGDLAAATESDESRFRMNSVTEESDGAYLFNFDITPAQNDEASSGDLLASLELQLENPDSALRQGEVTSGAISVASSERGYDPQFFTESSSDDEDDSVETTSSPAFIIGVSVAAAVVAAALIVTVFYVKSRKSTKVTSSFDRSKQQENGESAAGIPAADIESGQPVVPAPAGEKVWTFTKVTPSAN
jgi:hypothetical protein